MGIFPSTLVGSPDTEEYHVPTPAEVDEVRSFLTSFVPVELSNLILDYALYWPKVAYNVSQNNVPLIVTQYTGPRCCALTPKLSNLVECELEEGTFWKVKMVRFRVSSHDQGWCDQNNFKDPYAGSWTWLEAAIAREVDSDSLAENDKTKRNDIQQCIHDAISERGEKIPDGRQVITVENIESEKESSSVWHLQRNLRASREITTHEVVWMDEEPFDDMDRVPGEELRFLDATGAGKGRGFVNNLQPQDRIAVIGKALFPGWTNYIQDVEVDIYYSI